MGIGQKKDCERNVGISLGVLGLLRNIIQVHESGEVFGFACLRQDLSFVRYLVRIYI